MSKVAFKRLGDLITLKRGYDLPEKVRIAGPYPVISSSGVSGWHNEYKVEGPGVVTGRYGTLGEMYYVEEEYWPHNTALYVQDFKGNDPKYIYYLLSCLGRIRTSDKSAVPGVNRNELHEMAVPAIEDLTSQKKIREVLESIDEKIALNNRIIAELEAMAKTLYDYWFVQFDFPDANGKPYKTSGGKMVYNATLKREIPAGWRSLRLNELLQNGADSTGSDAFNSDVPYTPIDALPMKKMSFGDAYSSDKANTSLIKYKRNDILIGAMRVYFHRVCIAPFDGITRTTTLVLRPNKKEFLPYIYQVCNEEKTINIAAKISVGTQQPYVNWENSLENLVIAYPEDDSLIQRYSSAMGDLVKRVISGEKESSRLKKLREWLLPLLMNGQVTVK